MSLGTALKKSTYVFGSKAELAFERAGVQLNLMTMI